MDALTFAVILANAPSTIIVTGDGLHAHAYCFDERRRRAMNRSGVADFAMRFLSEWEVYTGDKHPLGCMYCLKEFESRCLGIAPWTS